MQSQHLHLQSVDSQQMHSREQRPHPQHLQNQQQQQQQQHHPFQIHHIQRQHQSRHHQQPSHPQSHHQQHPQSIQQQQHLQPSHQHRQQHQQTRRQQPNASHPQHNLFPHQSSQLGSLGLSTNTTAAFPVSSTPNHNNPQFTAQSLTRDNLQPLQQHQQSHFQPPLSQPSLHHQNPQNTNSFANSVQPMQMQPLLPSQQPNQAAFGNLANISGSMLQAAVVDDNPANSHQFANSQSGDALTSAYPWDSAHSAHGALTSQNLAAANHNNQQQPLLPMSLVGDTRGNNSQAFAAQNASGHNSFSGALNPNMGVLSSSLNNSMVGGLVNGNSLAQNVGNVAPALSPAATDLSQRNSFSIGEAPQRPTKTIKKGSGRAAQQKNAPSRVRNVRRPITSPVSTATLPNMSQPSGVGSNTQLEEHAGVSSQNTAMGSMMSSPPHAVRQARGIQGGKAKGRMRVPSRGMDSGEIPGPGAISSSNTSVGMVAVAPNQARDDPATGSTAVPMPGALAPQSFGDAKNGVSTTVAWSAPKKASTPRSRSRRKGDGTTTSLPVHLRNPKKGRARVFRECKACRQENHIRRSDCQNCKAPLPAGKRRRDGNPVYDSKRRVPSAAGAVPSSHVVSQTVGRARSGLQKKHELLPLATT